MKCRTPRPGLLAILLSLALSPADAGDSPADAHARGAIIYERCAACHALQTDRTGPRHCGLIGRRAGSVAGFAYSPAMRQSRLIWSEANLDRFIKAPMAFMPGTAMGYDGVKNDAERHDLLAFLRQEGTSDKCRNLEVERP